MYARSRHKLARSLPTLSLPPPFSLPPSLLSPSLPARSLSLFLRGVLKSLENERAINVSFSTSPPSEGPSLKGKVELNVVEDREGEHKRYRSLDPVHAQTLFLFSNLFIKILNVKRYRSLDPMLRPCV